MKRTCLITILAIAASVSSFPNVASELTPDLIVLDLKGKVERYHNGDWYQMEVTQGMDMHTWIYVGHDAYVQLHSYHLDRSFTLTGGKAYRLDEYMNNLLPRALPSFPSTTPRRSDEVEPNGSGINGGDWGNRPRAKTYDDQIYFDRNRDVSPMTPKL